MSIEELLGKLQEAIIDLEDEEVTRLIDEGLKAGVAPMDMITGGLSPGLNSIGEAFEKNERFMGDLVIAGEIMNDAMSTLRPVIEAGGQSTGETMILGTIEGDQHNIGKRIVGAVFTGAGYTVIDIGENVPASKFVEAAKKYKASVVGASAILGPLKPYCKVIHDALVEAGIRDDLIYVIGGWGMTQDWCDNTGADSFGENAVDALEKVRALRSGELPKWRDRVRR